MNRQALAALDAARHAIARLDRSRNADELSADLKEAWSGVETAIRALLGGSPLGGQDLIREARNRQMLSFDQANALAEFQAARERANDGTYHPTDGDINAAREGFLKLEASLMTPATMQDPTPGEAMSTKGLRTTPLGTPQPVPLPREGQRWWFFAIIIVVVAAIGAGVWYMVGRGSDGLAKGVQYWQSGQRELANAEFSRIAREHPEDAMPHVYLSRLAREAGNMALAKQEATLAVKADPGNVAAQREMGSVLLAAGDYELARRFYVRAVQLDTTDRASQGFLGCTLNKLGRVDEGMKWLNRAGQGSWSGCAVPMMPGATPPPIPR